MKIRVGICGYGNLGYGVTCALKQVNDMELVGIFTRRDPKTLEVNCDSSIVYSMDDILEFKDKIDVLILCGGSATDLPVQTPELVKHFNVVDSFDNHSQILNHFNNVNGNAVNSKRVSVISVGWDPGMFSINRLYSESVLPVGSSYTFWGKGVSQGHSDAIRRVKGVLDARQYTIPIEKALSDVRSSKHPNLTTREKHKRECFVVLKKDADASLVEKTIKEMPGYFADYDTTVNFISLEELKKNHSKIPHGGFVIRSGKTGINEENNHIIEYSLKLDSNPEFTSSILVAYARAAYKLYLEGNVGCFTAFDIAPRYLSPSSREEIIKSML